MIESKVYSEAGSNTDDHGMETDPSTMCRTNAAYIA